MVRRKRECREKYKKFAREDDGGVTEGGDRPQSSSQTENFCPVHEPSQGQTHDSDT